MREIGSRIYYEKNTGYVLVNTGDREALDNYEVPSVDSDFRTFSELMSRNKEMVGMVEFPYGAYSEDFKIQKGYRVNITTKELEFDYLNPNSPETPPVFQKALSVVVKELQLRQNATEPYVERVKTATEIYEKNKNKPDILLEDLKQLRIGKLKEECSNAIDVGFEVNGAHYGFNTHDQSNFTQQLLLVVAGQTTPIQWKTKNVGVIDLTIEQFKAVTTAATNHKMSQQGRYWTFEQLVKASKTKEEAIAIEW